MRCKQCGREAKTLYGGRCGSCEDRNYYFRKLYREGKTSSVKFKNIIKKNNEHKNNELPESVVEIMNIIGGWN